MAVPRSKYSLPDIETLRGLARRDPPLTAAQIGRTLVDHHGWGVKYKWSGLDNHELRGRVRGICTSNGIVLKHSEVIQQERGKKRDPRFIRANTLPPLPSEIGKT